MATATNRPDPSFAVTAIELLQSNSILEAAQLCASGVEHYPDYIGGYILLASAYESLGQHRDAQVIREALHARFPGLPILKSYAQVSQSVMPEPEALSLTDPDEPQINEISEPTSEVIDEQVDSELADHHDEIVESAEEGAEDYIDVIIDEEPADVDVEELTVNTTDEEFVEFVVEEQNVEQCVEEPLDVAAVEPFEQTIEDEVHDIEVEDIYLEIVEAPEIAGPLEVEDSTAEPLYVSHPNVLRLIEMAPVTTDTRIIRSASVRLIPGLEFTSLRFEGIRSRGRREITSLLDPPAFRTFHQVRRPTRSADAPEVRKKPVTLEELAARLTDARLPKAPAVDQEISKEDFSAQQSPILITETIARIYMQQGSYELAIEAFKNLQKHKPEKHDEFDKLIKECERKRT